MRLCEIVQELRDYLASGADIPPKTYAAIRLAADELAEMRPEPRQAGRPWTDER